MLQHLVIILITMWNNHVNSHVVMNRSMEYDETKGNRRHETKTSRLCKSGRASQNMERVPSVCALRNISKELIEKIPINSPSPIIPPLQIDTANKIPVRITN